MGMKRALLIGIDDYENFGTLEGCVNDVLATTQLLANHQDGSPNFHCRSYTTKDSRINRKNVLEHLDELFKPGADVALFYFAGHGSATNNDVIIVAQDGDNSDLGVPLSAIMGKVNNSLIGEIIIILDCCFSGAAGGVPQLASDVDVLKQGVAILTASRSDQISTETPTGRGLFSVYFCAALDGGAADVIGKVTLAGIYSYLDESFGPWDQRPTFKASLNRLHVLRSCFPSVTVEELRKLPKFFLNYDDEMNLDPSFEPTEQPRNATNEGIFEILQRFRDAKLVETVGGEHMYYAALNSKSCRLTPLGQHYWRMAMGHLL